MRQDEASIVLMGHHLEPSEVLTLEQELTTQPDAYEDRLRLIGYYFKHYQCCENAGKRRIDHIVWLIRKHPDFNPILASYLNTHLLDRRAYACIKAAWHSAIKRHGQSVDVHCNMSGFVQLQEPELALQLCEKALQLAPANAAVITRLQKLRTSMETLVANRDAFMTSSEPYFILGAVRCPGTGKVPTPRAGSTPSAPLADRPDR